jgi:hypothetical protein
LFGWCENSSPTAKKFDGYGYGSSFRIDSSKSFVVKTRFYSSKKRMDGGSKLTLKYIETTLTQGENSISAVQEDKETMAAMETWLRKGMRAVLSNYDAGQDDSPSGQC